MTPTPRQLATLRDIAVHITMHGIAPTLDELRAIAGIAKPTVYERLEALKKRGLIDRSPFVTRSISITEQGYKCLSAGKVCACCGGTIRKR